MSVRELWNEYTTYVRMKNLDGELTNNLIPVCGLCGNSGLMDTRRYASCLGQNCGIMGYCICPNGRAKRKQENGAPKWGGSSIIVGEGAKK